jgi:3-oxoacyl-[acyl-carrier-protein] synthase 3
MEEHTIGCKIAGTGHYVPEKILTNDDLSRMVDTSDEWISVRTGIKERHILQSEETCSGMSVNAAKAALEDAGVLPEDIDYLICATVHGDYFTPSLACCVQKKLGLQCAGIDVNAACAGFLYALDFAQCMIKTKKNIQRILVIATEGMSRLVDWSDRNTCVLFGDGSGAAVVERSDSDCMLSFVEHVQGNWEVLNIDYGKTGRPCVHMNGGEVFKFAVNSACRDILEAMKAAEITDKEMINHVILHQANKRITNAVVSKLGIPEERYISTIHKYGNTSSSGCAIALDELNRSGHLQKGDKIAFAAFGGGLTSAAAIIRWNK